MIFFRSAAVLKPWGKQLTEPALGERAVYYGIQARGMAVLHLSTGDQLSSDKWASQMDEKHPHQKYQPVSASLSVFH
jgi:hypothetical protein